MKSAILFLNGGTPSDAIAYAAVCYKCRTNIVSVTVADTDAAMHQKIRAAFQQPDTAVLFIASLGAFCERLDTYEMEQCDVVFASIHDLCQKISVPSEVESALLDISADSPQHLPSAMAKMLFKRIGLIEFGNMIAHKLIIDPSWDIVRDEDVQNILAPKGAINA